MFQNYKDVEVTHHGHLLPLNCKQFQLKWLILCYVHFTTILKKENNPKAIPHRVEREDTFKVMGHKDRSLVLGLTCHRSCIPEAGV